MAFFTWTDELATGIEEIDDQHMHLIGIVNELYEAMRKGKGREIISGTLNDLIDYTDKHFSNEERAFAVYGYPAMEEHRRQHAILIKQLDEQRAKHEKKEISLTVSTLEFLTNWVREHIMVEDMKYVPYLKGKKIDS
jgi:hemerythrin